MSEKIKYQAPVLMVVDIGGSKYISGFIDAMGNILYMERREWKSVEPKAIVDQIKEALHDICKRHPDLSKRVAAGGLTIPGFANPITGVWVDSDFLIINNLPICQILSNEFDIPFFSDNDCNACALAERYFGGAKNQGEFLYLTVSTGIGGAFYLDGELYYGGFWHAGEIGLFVMEEYGRPSDTGSVNGVIEMYASGRGLTKNYIEAGGKEKIDEKIPEGPEISRLATEGDKVALKALKLEGCYLGRAIANACAFADFSKIILGGGLSLLFTQYKEELYKEFYRIQPKRRIEIEATGLGYSGAFLGAAAVAIRGIEGFHRGKGAGQADKSILRVNIAKQVEASLELEGHVCKCQEAVFGSFLAAKSINDQGESLNQLVAFLDLKELEQSYEAGNTNADKILSYLGNQVGKAVACACILLDPGKVVLKGDGTHYRPFQNSLLETVIRETYYRGNLPFIIQYE
jgi:predicted NBD/HSP70 family sugar kinase